MVLQYLFFSPGKKIAPHLSNRRRIMKELVEEICAALGKKPTYIIKPKWREQQALTTGEVIQLILENELTDKNCLALSGIGYGAMQRTIKKNT